MTADLIAAITTAVRTLPAAHIKLLAGRIKDYPEPSNAYDLLSRPPTQAFRDHAGAIITAWADDPAVDGATISVMLHASLSGYETGINQQRVELVWTGPASGSIPVRRASQVLLDLIGSAQDRLIVVTFASRHIGYIDSALRDAAKRGVRLAFLLENHEASGGRLTHDAVSAYSAIPNSTLYEWPTKNRPFVGNGKASMHAKVAIADDHTAYISSTNLTDAGIDKNMECGVLIRNGVIPRDLDQHFTSLIYAGQIAKVSHEFRR